MTIRHRRITPAFFVLLASLHSLAAVGARGVMVREGVIYISPDAQSAKLSNIGRGREVVVLERTPGWVHLVGTVEVNREEETERNVTGWMVDKGVITPDVPDGDKIIFGEAVDSEYVASQGGGRHGAAQDAMRLYAGMAEYFPNSPLAAEALYRSADIRWQLDSADAATRPSAKMRDPHLRVQIDESYMKRVMKKFPGTKWADEAAYHLIDNKLCGDWEAQAQCPVKEAGYYIQYVADYPKSPKAPEALYKAAWRYASLVVIYKTDNQPAKADGAAAQAISVAKKLMAQYPEANDWSTRAERLVYMVQSGIPAFGNALE